MIALFNQLQAAHPQATAIAWVLDNARYNHSAEIKACVSSDDCRIRLVYPTVDTPNLYLIEWLWGAVQAQDAPQRALPNFAPFKAAVDGFFAPSPATTTKSNPDVWRVPLHRQTGPATFLRGGY